ncbi:MAG: phosphoribosylformylglycinamidine synthase [Deltaproteobacteria bacterium]|nr:phosphoribosylformylglycinamidine synthase [Deltaproteobacteria bacterium]
MIHRIEVGFKQSVRDVLGERTCKRIVANLGIDVREVRTIEVFTVEGSFSREELEVAAAGPFSDPVIQVYSVDRPLARNFDWLIEVGFRPGVTDNVGKTAREALELLYAERGAGGRVAVYTSRQYLIMADIDRKNVDAIASKLLANDLIERYAIMGKDEWDAERGMPPFVPRVTGEDRPVVQEIDLAVADEELLLISEKGVLALNLDEMKAIQAHFQDGNVLDQRRSVGLGAKITDVELESLAQTWSEHCKHKIFNAFIEYCDEEGNGIVIDSLFTSYIKESTRIVRESRGDKDWCRSVFVDNAGVIKFNDDYNLIFKVETHNSPSALDPYGGALTGIVGVNRDPFGTGTGAKLIFNTDVFCFASPFFDKPLPKRILHPRRIYDGVREGVEHGGNKSGIPTVNGCIVFDERYLGKPLVYCGTGGMAPARSMGKPSHRKEIRPGDAVVMTGGRIGKDGIHGATFSSEELHEGSPVTAVQIGDPITQKKMTDFLLRARDLGLYRAITDNGAGGLSSSVGEMASLCGGCEIDLQKAPLKYAGLQPWEILVSEAQERMTLAVPPENIEEFKLLAEKMAVEATVLGTFTDTGKFHIRYGEQTAAYLDMDFLHNGVPQLRLTARWLPTCRETPRIAEPADYGKALHEILGRLNICSKESVVRQYDHEVQGGSVVKPLVGSMNDGPSDAAVVRPILDSFEGVVVANGICPRYSDIDTYHMAACAIDEAIRNAVAVGASLDHLAGLDNFCWCDPVESKKTPDGAYKLAQLVRANKALYDYTIAYGVPCISGKDSMKNDYIIGDTKISIPPTLLFSAIGRIADVRKAVTMDAKRPGDIVYILGETYEELGASEWYAHHGFIGHSVPRVNAGRAKKRYQAIGRAIDQGLVASCHDCSDGGLGIAIAETAFAGGLGIDMDLAKVPYEGQRRNDYMFFSESQSRLIVTVHRDLQESFEKIFEGQCCAEIGIVNDTGIFSVRGIEGQLIISEPLEGLKASWQRPLNF